MTPATSPLNGGALAAVGPRRRHHARAPSSAPHPRSPPRSAPPPGSTGCCWISSTALAARSRSATSFPAAGAYGVPTVVRVETGASGSGWVGCWTCGAAGIMLPRMDRPRRSAGAIRHLRFPPRGDRGVATYNRACRFGLDPGALDRADDEVLVVVQIESAAAVAAVDEIAAVDGVDVLFIGPRISATTSASPATPPRRRSSRPLGHRPGRGQAARQGRRAARQRRRSRRAAARAGLGVRRHRLRLHPARRAAAIVGARPRSSRTS